MDAKRANLVEKVVDEKTDMKMIDLALAIFEKEDGGTLPEQNCRLLSEKEAAKYLDVARSSLWKYRKEGLKFFRLHGRIFYSQKDIDNFIITHGG